MGPGRLSLGTWTTTGDSRAPISNRGRAGRATLRTLGSLKGRVTPLPSHHDPQAPRDVVRLTTSRRQAHPTSWWRGPPAGSDPTPTEDIRRHFARIPRAL